MQFPNPIVRALVIYDNNGNPVVIIGPGPIIRVINPATQREISIEPGITNPTIFFWNAGHTDSAFINTAGDTITGFNGFSYVSNMPGTPTLRPRLLFSTNRVDLSAVSATQTVRGGYASLTTTFAEIGFTDVNSDTRTTVTADTQFVRMAAPAASLTARTVVYDNTTGFMNLGGGISGDDWVAFNRFNGWGLQANTYTPAFRRRLDGAIQFRGCMSAGTTTDGTAVLNFPIIGFVPLRAQFFPVAMQPATAAGKNVNLQYNTDGIFYIYGAGGASYVDLGGIVAWLA